jgi:hypothetical protein
MAAMTGNEQTDSAPAEAPQPQGWSARLKHAFAVEPYDETSLSAEERQAIERLAARIDERGLTTAAIVWMQSNRHFNWVSSQAMVFFQPFFDMAHPLLNSVLRNFGLAVPPAEYPQLMSAFEKRYSVEYFIQQLELHAARQGPKEPAQADQPEPPAGDAPE